MYIYKSKSKEGQKFFKKIISRQIDMEGDTLFEVKKILDDVRKYKDTAVRKYTKEFDNVYLEDFEVNKREFDFAETKVEDDLKKAMKKAYENIWRFHERQISKGFEIDIEDIKSGSKYLPIEKAGIYVPGGKAAYPSSVLMNAIPARVAGVKEIIMIAPPSKDGSISNEVLYGARLCNVDRVFKIGGAQGIGALAYGTESVPKVDIITGPGNIYVSMAKKLVYGSVNIDMIAGPSEILILSDGLQNPSYIASDLLAQAEHDELASSILLTLSMTEGKKVSEELKVKVRELPKEDICIKSLENYGAIIVCESEEEMVEIANEIAPEHLEILGFGKGISEKIRNAGCIFLGEYSPEALGDYIAGPNHILPTNGTARFFSPLGTDTFMKRMNYISSTKEGLENLKESIGIFAKKEGLIAHERSITGRF